MAYVVTAGCTKDGACKAECATDSIVEGVFTDADGTVYDQMFINPDTCIDCGICEQTCPKGVIFDEMSLPDGMAAYSRINAAFYS